MPNSRLIASRTPAPGSSSPWEGSTIDGSQFRGLGWQRLGQRWRDGEWEGGGREAQPEMTEAIQHLREARKNLESAIHNKDGHRETALQLINQAITEARRAFNTTTHIK